MVGEGGGDEKRRMRFAWRSPRNALPIFAIQMDAGAGDVFTACETSEIVSLLFDIHLVSVRVKNERWFLT